MSDQQPTGPDPQRADEQEATGGRTRGFSRRRLVAGTGLAGMLGIAGFGGAAIGRATADRGSGHSELTYPFRGDRQAGILTPAQDNMYFAAFDLDTDDVEDGRDRFGLRERMPEALSDGVPKCANEKLVPGGTGGDLMIQACSNDPQVCVHAIRNLTRIGFGTAVLKWGQIGYGRTLSTSTEQETPRNLFGFKDGTANLKAEDGESTLVEHVWVQDGDDDAAAWCPAAATSWRARSA
ncbi:Dyp-type peroxidase domain-containing protein [Kocuria palustris]|uniref:Dyp-type peroxidase domain-containing protein n=1 Tax=Kocuria palustris TaxID=71999 RepID=UPI0032E800FA